MKVIFILAFVATLFALTTAYYPGGQLPADGRLGASRGLTREDARDLTWEDEEEEQRLKVKGLLKEIGRKVIVPKIIDKLQTLDEGGDELQKIKIGKIIRTFVIPKIIAALEESAEDEGAIDLMDEGPRDPHGPHGPHSRARPGCFPKWKCRGI